MLILDIIDPALWDVWFAGIPYDQKQKKTLSVKDWCLSERADLCFNLALFDMKTGASVNYVHNSHGDISYGGASDVLQIGENKCKGYSNGIVNGAVKVPFPLGGSRTRNGIGLTIDGRIIIAQSSTNLTEKNFCQKVNTAVMNQGNLVKLFVLQDGGGSTSSYSAISKLNFAPEGGRKVATVTCARRKNTIPKVTRVLRYGCKGNDVKLLQMILVGVEIDGSYGLKTRSRVIAAQKALGLKADGICGPATQLALGLR